MANLKYITTASGDARSYKKWAYPPISVAPDAGVTYYPSLSANWYSVRKLSEPSHSLSDHSNSEEAFSAAWNKSVTDEVSYMVYDMVNSSILAIFKCGNSLPFGAGYTWLKIHHPDYL